MRLGLVAVLLLLICGCRIEYVTEGSDSFLRHQVELVAGQTTSQELAEALGPPQIVRSRGGDLLFHYRFVTGDHYSITIRYYGGQWLRGSIETTKDLSLIAVFGPDDRLRFLAPSRDASGRFPVTEQALGTPPPPTPTD